MLSFLLTGFVVVVVFSIVILVHELGHFLVARKTGVKVERFSLGLGKVLLSKTFGDTEYAICAIPFGGYVKMAGDEPSDTLETKPGDFYAQPPGKRFWIIFAGVAVNCLFAIFIFCFLTPTFWVGKVLENSPAYHAGISEGDRIIAVDGKETKYFYEVIGIISGKVNSEPVEINIERDKEIFNISVIPEILVSKDKLGKEIKRGQIGVAFSTDINFIKGNLIKRITTSLTYSKDNIIYTYKLLWKLITKQMPVKGNVGGPVMIMVMIGDAAKAGLIYLVFLVGNINLALAIFNLLPFPILDGGHIMFLLLEKIRGKRLSVKTQEVVQYVSLVLLCSFVLFITWSDITGLFFK